VLVLRLEPHELLLQLRVGVVDPVHLDLPVARCPGE
jgi:hypothetical protein